MGGFIQGGLSYELFHPEVETNQRILFKKSSRRTVLFGCQTVFMVVGTINKHHPHI